MEKLEPDIVQLLKAARRLFLKTYLGKDVKQEGYIEVLAAAKQANLAEVRLGEEKEMEAGQASYHLQDPLYFLTGLQGAKLIDRMTSEIVAPPFLALVLGEYGTGKTELFRQLTRFIDVRGGSSGIHALPISLVRSRSQLEELTESCSEEKFLAILFSRLFEKPSWQDSVAQKETLGRLVERIRDGQIFLLLDGLDELIFEHKYHSRFLRCLVDMLSGSTTQPGLELRVRTALSVRTEYLAAFELELEHQSYLQRLLKRPTIRDTGLRMYSLELGVFGNAAIHSYLDARGRGEDFERFLLHEAHLDELRRPLLLKLWCDAREKFGDDFSERDLTAAEVIDKYIESASEAMRAVISAPTTWDRRKIAEKCVELYGQGRTLFRNDEVRFLLEVDRIDVLPALQAIHKCPFLQRRTKRARKGRQGHVEEGVEFSHRAFLEFFTALGVHLAIDEHDNVNPFNELVLNVEMRKFLRYFMGDDLFKAKARDAWGLEGPENGELEGLHEILLDFMTRPGKLELAVIDKALKLLGEEGIDPRYQTYAYEAVAIHLRANSWTKEYKGYIDRFKDLLETRIEETVTRLKPQRKWPANQEKSLLLLVERIARLGETFGFEWMEDYLALGHPKKGLRAQFTSDRYALIIGRIEASLKSYREAWGIDSAS